MNVLLTSVGRRPYLIDWFKQAQAVTGVDGLVVAADADPYSPSRTFADVFERAPLASDPNYERWLGEILKKHNIQIAVSINDFELSKWAALPQTDEFDVLIRPTRRMHSLAEDKLAMHHEMTGAGVNVPQTWLLSDVLANPSLIANTAGIVLKGRFGSASRGLRLTTAAELEAEAREAYREVTGPDGATVDNFEDAGDLLIVQERILGQEYGVDIVNDLDGHFAGTLAREKKSMRSGETDRAVSVPAGPFTEVGQAISGLTEHRGLIDTDIIVDQAGTPWLIDLNPRFGGGYPFSHVAGAHVPAAYLLWAEGKSVEDELEYRPGVLGSKFVGITEVAQ